MRKFSTTLRATTVLLRSGTKRSCPCLVERDHLDVEDEGRVGGDATLCTLTIGKSRWNCEQTFTADLHASDTLVPSLDDLTLAELELELEKTH